MRKTVMITLGLLLSVSLVGCGSSDKSSSGSSDYCKTLKASKDDITKFTGNSVPSEAEFTAFQKKIGTLEDSAPSAVSEDWKKLGTVLTKLSDALKDAGITFDQLGDLTNGTLPPGVSQADAMKLAQTLNSIGSDKEFENASKEIGKHAKSECGIKIDVS